MSFDFSQLSFTELHAQKANVIEFLQSVATKVIFKAGACLQLLHLVVRLSWRIILSKLECYLSSETSNDILVQMKRTRSNTEKYAYRLIDAILWFHQSDKFRALKMILILYQSRLIIAFINNERGSEQMRLSLAFPCNTSEGELGTMETPAKRVRELYTTDTADDRRRKECWMRTIKDVRRLVLSHSRTETEKDVKWVKTTVSYSYSL